MPGVVHVVSLTFTLVYGGIITHSFITCKVHLKQSGKVPQPVALRGVENKIFAFTFIFTSLTGRLFGLEAF